ncbi:MAG TPA: hypothetical protein VHU82_10530 [Vicinamibacterales bacterium]|jgi:hypothetical protein|nr:hypothetical protein [Vicinamibacterales bacterium]
MSRTRICKSTCITSISATLLLIAFTAPRASAQDPFSIDGVVTDTANSHASGSALKTTDPSGNSKELGPINSNATKLLVIGNAPPPMLGLTIQNAQVDLNTIYTQTEQATNGHLWYYFGWARDSANGSGFISIEFEQAALDPACDYTNKTQAQLIASCNPWKNRQAGDFLLLWDQQGSSTDIYKRVFSGVKPNLVLGPLVPLGTAEAQFSADGFRGEAAVDLTQDVFPAGGACQTFANIIPNTVTGNSDTADYKDTVLSAFPPVSNCGSVTVTKATTPAGLSGTFTYTLAAGGANIFNAGGVDADCSVSGASDLTQCEGTLTTSAQSPTNTDTIANLVEHDTTWTLTESTPGADFELASVDCTLGDTTYHLFGAGQTTVGAFKVAAGQTTACTIVNKLVKQDPGQTTAQAGAAGIKDEIDLTGVRPGASDASSATATFRLYSGNTCIDSGAGANLIFTSSAIPLTYGGNPAGSTAFATMPNVVPVAAGTTYYWKVTYTGDAFNNGFTTPCGQETALVVFTFVP